MDNIAVLIPCYNEEKTIAKVVYDCKEILPSAKIYVYDNNSNDNTIVEAKKAGAIVGLENRQGKGNVVRRMFSDIDADVYILLDGDDTYDIESLPSMLDNFYTARVDMLVGKREAVSGESYRSFHQVGNKMFNKVIRTLFGQQFNDIFSGFRIFSKRFVKSFPCLSSGFEIETEISVHALEMNLPVMEVSTPYSARPEGSVSKLNTYKDGLKILFTILRLFRIVRPMAFFFIISLIFGIVAMAFFMPIFINYLQTGLVPKVPTLILVSGTFLLSFISFFSGMILDNGCRARLEAKRLHYLSVK